MSDYTKELEAQIEALKAALDKERDWIDYLNKRKDSQKYRRWCTKFVVKFRNIPSGECSKIPLRYCYSETVHETLNDARNTLIFYLDDMIEEYYSDWIRKIHRKVKGKNKPTIDISISIYLYDQRNDKEVYTKIVFMSLVYPGKKLGARLVRIHGIEPGQVQTLDEVILPHIHPDDPYINKWEKLHPEV